MFLNRRVWFVWSFPIASCIVCGTVCMLCTCSPTSTQLRRSESVWVLLGEVDAARRSYISSAVIWELELDFATDPPDLVAQLGPTAAHSGVCKPTASSWSKHYRVYSVRRPVGTYGCTDGMALPRSSDRC